MSFINFIIIIIKSNLSLSEKYLKNVILFNIHKYGMRSVLVFGPPVNETSTRVWKKIDAIYLRIVPFIPLNIFNRQKKIG